MTAPDKSKIEDEVAQFVRAHFPQFAGEDIHAGTELLARGLDSLAVLDLMTFLSERFTLELDEGDFAAEHFETVGSLAALVLQKTG